MVKSFWENINDIHLSELFQSNGAPQNPKSKQIQREVNSAPPLIAILPGAQHILFSFKINFKDINQWSKLDEVKIFQNSRPQIPHLEQDKVDSDITSGLYSKGVDLHNNKIKDRRKTLNLFKE